MDDILNLIEVSCVDVNNPDSRIMVLFKNTTCELPDLYESGQQVRRSFEIKQQILEAVTGSQVLVIDEQAFAESDDKEGFLLESLGMVMAEESETRNDQV